MLKSTVSFLVFVLFVIMVSIIPVTASCTHAPAVDVAILLDTSNSMDGLINQAKSQLWTIVQQFARAEKNGDTPLLRVALFEYGNTNLPVSEGYLRQVVPLEDDLDVLSEALFGLSTKGGDEYCGQVIDEAITRLDWASESGTYRVVFIAGNEEFTQGSVDYQDACRRAVKQGIIINTIHCGDYDVGVADQWQLGAQLAGGEFFNIDQDRAVVHIRCPQDPRIIFLSDELNDTYLWFGSSEKRGEYFQNQMTQDSNASMLSSSVAVGRSLTKSSRIYNNCRRDLVDALEVDDSFLLTLPVDQLPDIMQRMTKQERAEYVREMTDKRTELKKEISELAVERELFLAAESERTTDELGSYTLGDAVVVAIWKQLHAAGFAMVGSDGAN